MADTVVAVHAVTAFATLLALVVVAVWGAIDFLQGARLSRRYDGALWTVQALMTLQVAAGIAALLLGRWPHTGRHLTYGSAASLLPWAVWLLVRRRRQVSLDMAVACVVAAGLGIAAAVAA